MNAAHVDGGGHSFRVTAADGYPLAAERHGDGHRHLLVAGATGAPARYYRSFARFMAARGYSVWLFDYRGCGASRPASLRGFAADVADWGRLDLEAVLRHVLRHDDAPAFVGHSIGGFCLGLAPSAVHLRRIVTVAAQTALPFDAPLREWPRALALWHGFMPLATLAWGYFPASRFGLGDDLPRGAALQWALRPLRGSFVPETDADAIDFVRVRAPLQAWYSPVDALGTRRAVARLHRQFAVPAVLRDAGTLGHAYGHFDYFRRGTGEPLWAAIADFLEPRTRASTGKASPRPRPPPWKTFRMNLWLRMLLVLLRLRGKPRVALLDTTRITVRVWPGDLDINRHVNNGRYLTLADLGRLDWFLRTGTLAYARGQKAWPIVGDAIAKFRRDLRLFQTCTIESRMLGWEGKWAFLEHRFLREGRVIGVVAIRGMFRGRSGPIPPGEFLAALDGPVESPPLPRWVLDWHHGCDNLSGLLREEEARL